jgi:catechol 2,3-dioxygenase-like lactoylglutathione lyase family enzyme
VINGSHVVVYTQNADADRAFFRDVLGMAAVDAGGGWLIFALPPAEVAFHPAKKNDLHQLYLMCEDLSATVKELEGHGVRCDEPSEEGWGIITQVHLPGSGRLGLYQPKHPTAF